MAKPIFLVGFTKHSDPQQLEFVQSALEAKLSEDYHVLVYRTSENTEVTFKVLNAINSTDAELSEIIQKTKDEISLLIKERTELIQKIQDNATS